jgi:hypothetical protein
MRFDGDPILRSQNIEIKRRHDRGQRGARGLVTTHFEAITAGTQVVGVVNHPGRKPEHLPLQGAKARQPARVSLRVTENKRRSIAQGDTLRFVHLRRPRDETSDISDHNTAIGESHRGYCI